MNRGSAYSHLDQYEKAIAPIAKPGYIERTSVLDFVGAASSRDRFNSRLEAAPTI